MTDFIRQLADEAGQHYTKSSVRLRGSGGKNDGINDMIRRKGGRGSGSLDPESLDAQIRKAAAANNVFGDVDDQIRGSTGRICTGISSGQAPSINTELAGRISQAAEDMEKYGLDTNLADQVSQKIIAARGGNV
uniref:Uncharacterized protein n=1 Tax=uncultured prokaryote TaxID=198431 RepID=A0A0H5PZ16_9ZZZZ|nr:hypothetical protein [uncultured prokaryote]